MIIVATLTASVLGGWPLASVMPVLGALSTAPASARAHVHVTLADWQLSELVETGQLVVSELVTNALEASTAPTGEPVYVGGQMAVIGLRLHSNRSRLLIEVYDMAPGSPVLRNAASDAESGRGMHLVDALTRGRWGWHRVQLGQRQHRQNGQRQPPRSGGPRLRHGHQPASHLRSPATGQPRRDH
jgi:anti-sigma regulatory factor (Ser/Thr protein kinase)